MAAAPAIDGDDQADEIRRAVAQAIQRAVDGAISVGAAVDQAIAAALTLVPPSTPAERVAEEAAQLLAEYDELGGGRDAAAKVAKRHCRDPQQREIMAQRIRRLARRRKTGTARFAG